MTKKTKLRKVVLLALIVGVIITLFTLTAAAADYTFTDRNTEGGRTVTITAASTSLSGDITLPYSNSYGATSYPVTVIDDSAFKGCSGITSITFPSQLVRIGANAFEGCTGLTYNTYDNLQYIGNGSNPYYAVVGIASTDVSKYTLHRDTKIICGKVFYDCDTLKEIVLPQGLVGISDYAFYGCDNLTSIVVPSSIQSIGACAFASCTNLERAEIYSSTTSPATAMFSSCSSLEYLLISDLEYPVGIYYNSGLYAHNYYPIGYIFGGSGTTACNMYRHNTEYAEGQSITCYFPNSLKTICVAEYGSLGFAHSFNGCTTINNVIIKSGLTNIAYETFFGFDGLQEITIPKSVKTIEGSALEYCENLQTIRYEGTIAEWLEIEFAKGNEYSGYGKWDNGTPNYTVICSDGSFTKDDPIFKLSVAEGKFEDGSAVTYKKANESITLIAPSTKEGCKFSHWEFNNTKIGTTPTFTATVSGAGNYRAVYENTLKYTLSDDGTYYTVNGIGTYTGTDLVIPEKYDNIPITSIGERAFYNCTSLTSVTIPDNVTSIGDYAFSSCNKLVEVINKSGLNITKGSTSNGYVAYYAFEVHNGDSKIVNKDGYLFYTYDGVNYLLGYVGNDAELVLPESYNGENYQIYQYAFYNCDSLTSVTIGDSVTSIGRYAFAYCSSLTSVTIGDSVTSIGYYAFYKCTSLTSVTIPDSVTSIGDYAFYECTSLTSVTIGDSVTSIGYYAFYKCTSLTSVTIPDSVTSIGRYAFNNCKSLTSVTIGDSVTSIGSYAFNDCYNLMEVVNKSDLNIVKGSTSYGYVGYYAIDVHNGTSYTVSVGDYCFYVASDGSKYLYEYVGSATELILPANYDGQSYGIWNLAFKDCTTLKSIIVPDGVTSIGRGAFSGCSSLESITLPFVGTSATATSASANTVFGRIFGSDSYEGGVSIRQDYGWDDDFDYVYSCIPKTLKSVTVTGGKLFYGAFYNCTNITNVTLSNRITSIGNYVFYGCSALTNVTIPDSITSVGSSVFSNCESLQYNVYDNAKYLGNENNPYTYLAHPVNRDITTCVIHYRTKLIGSSTFSGCYKLVEVINKSGLNITKGSTSSGYVAYYALEVHKGDSKIVNNDGYLFYTYNGVNYLVGYVGNDTELVLPDSYNGQNYEIYKYAFRYCDSLTSVTIPDSVTSIGDYAFYGCSSLTSVTIGDSVTSVGGYAFQYCWNLKNITIPDSVTSIGSSAFYNCTALEKIYFNATAMNDLSSNNYVFYKAGQSGNGIEVVVGKNVTKIPAYLFYPYNSSSCAPKITSVKFEEGSVCESIGSYAFYDCTTLTSVHISDLAEWCNISFGGSSANPLYYAKNLYLNNELVTELVIPDSVTSIGNYAFYNCTGLTSVTIPDSVTSIGSYAFYYCTTLTSVTIPNSVTSIGSSAFYNCTGLTSVTIPDSVTSIGSYAFYYCTTLTSVTIPNSVTSIGSSAFYNCTSLTSVTIGDSVTSIGSSAFYSCDSLKQLTVYSETVTIYNSEYTIPSFTTIRGYAGSTAEAYATKYGRTFEVIKELLGDMDGNDGVNTNDAIYLLRYTLEADKYPINQNGDMNGDGEVDSADAIYLLRHVLLPEKYPLN